MGKRLSGLRLGILAAGVFGFGTVLIVIAFCVWWFPRKPPIPATPVTAQYDNNSAFTMLMFADSAYCGDRNAQSPILDWNCPSCAENKLQDIKLLSDDSQETFGFVGLRPNSSTIVASFRGPVMCSKGGKIDASSDRSCGSINFATMYDMYLEEMKFGSYGKVLIHRGYKKAYLSLKDQVTKAVHALLDQRNCSNLNATCKVIYTGHSMGCALATLAFFDQSVNGIGTKGIKPFYPTFKNPRVKTSLYGFGCPPVGNDEFLLAWQTDNYDLSSRTWRIVHGLDLVNHIGNHFHLSSYAQIPREVYYKGDGFKPYNVCDGTGEDIACSAQNSFWIADWNMEDHYKYLGHRMGCCAADNRHCAFPDLSHHYKKPYPLAAEARVSYPFTWAMDYEHNINSTYAALIVCIAFIVLLIIVSLVLTGWAVARCYPQFFGNLVTGCKSAGDRARYLEKKKSRKKLIGSDSERNWDQF